MKARPTPPVIPDQVAPYPVDPHQRRLNLARPAVMGEAAIQQRKHATSLDKTGGIVSIANVYESRHPWPKDTRIASLRIIQVLPKSAPGRDNPKIGYGTEKNARAVLGTVPVEADGSVCFRLPPYVPVYLQVLNEQGMAVQSMRTDIYAAPNEKLSCVGCHERRWTAASPMEHVPLALRREPSILKPEPDGSNPFNFARLVQPVLDRKCVACHSREEKAHAKGPVPTNELATENLDFPDDLQPPKEKKTPVLNSQARKGPVLNIGTPDRRGWPESYRNLQKVAFYFDSGSFTTSKTLPGQFGALASPLYDRLQKGHHDVKLTPDELRRITLWLDCNSDFYGTYENLEAQARGEIVKPILE